MKITNKFIAVLLVLGILTGLFQVAAHAADSPIHINMESYTQGKLKLAWEPIRGIDSIEIRYNKPDIMIPETIALGAGATSCEITGLLDDYIYNIELYTVKGGVKERKGLIYFLPGMTFEASIVPEPMDDTSKPPYDSNGGREIGTKPRLKLNWIIPRIFNGSSFVTAKDAAEYIEDQLNTVYGTKYNIGNFNYKINISQDSMDMSGNAAVDIIQEGSGYKALVSGSTASTKVIMNGNKMEIELVGRRDRNAALPIATADGELPHPDILPGTVYFMNIQSMVQGYHDAVVLGDNGSSSLKGSAYTYTPIRFQLSKDEFDNVYVKVYTVNQGGLSLPNLYYEVQTNTSDSAYGWVQRAKIDPDYFKDSSGLSQEFGIIPIVGSNAGNRIFYRVITASDGNDIIRSQNLSYTMELDSSKPPIPKSVKIKDRERVIDEESGKISTDVTISWDEPLNWKEIKENSDNFNDVYYCFTINISQANITKRPYPSLIDEINGINYEDRYPAVYRIVKYVNARTVLLENEETDKIRESNGRLEYTLKGFDLFTGTDGNGSKTKFSNEFYTKMGIEADYPSFLLSNKVYYMQMFTVKGNPELLEDIAFSSSDKSVTVSFTTLAGDEKDIPISDEFKLSEIDGNTYTNENGVISNIIKLQFKEIKNIKWSDYTTFKFDNKIYYDLYMSTSSGGGEILIGSTDNVHSEYKDKNNVAFDVINDGQNRYITATIKDFTKEPAITSFGYKLTPNTNYYFKLKTRLVMAKKRTGLIYPEDFIIKESPYSFIVPVTTIRGDMNPPDPGEKIPVAPEDFSIALDKDGNELRTSNGVVLNWGRVENNVRYTLICTSFRMPMNAEPSQYLNDPVYQDFKKKLKLKGNDTGIVFDPGLPANQYPHNFEYISSTSKCIYSIDEWLYPNRLYFFSLRAENKENGNLSPWISIPVTTKLIEAPVNLEVLKGGELGAFWTDPSADTRPEDYNIYIKGAKDKNYKLLSRSQYVVARDSKTVIINDQNHYVYYLRINNLQLDSSYDIKVFKGSETNNPIYQKIGAYTRNGYHEIEVKWQGIKGYRYELAIKEANEVEYTTLTPFDLETYIDVNGKSNPYYLEETPKTSNGDGLYYYAKIKSMLVTLPNGAKERRILQSNKKYHIKVRAIKIDTEDTTLVSYSKYTGSVEARTEFKQEDYDKDKDKEDREVKFLDKIEYLEESLFWRVAIRDGSANSILIKDEKVVNAIHNSRDSSLIIDISQFAPNINTDVVYVPLNVVKAVNSEGKNLVLRFSGAEFTIRPGSLDTETGGIKTLQGKPMINDKLIKLTVVRKDSSNLRPAENAQPLSRIIEFNAEAIGISEKTAKIEKDIHDRLYNSDGGLLTQKLDILLSVYPGAGNEFSKAIEKYINELIKLVELELSDYTADVLRMVKVSGVSSNINTFNKPVLAKLYHTDKKGLKYPSVMYNGKNSWQKITSDVVCYSNYLFFNADAPGKYTVLLAWNAAGKIPENHWAKKEIEILLSKYDLSRVFEGVNKTFAPEDIVTAKEIVLLYEEVMGRSDRNSGLDIKSKVKRLGLDDIISISRVVGNITRQETAGVLARAYGEKMGVDIDSLKASRTIYINDEGLIENRFLKPVVLMLDKNILTLDVKGNYSPKASMNRAEVAVAFVRLLEKTGDI